MHVSASLLLAAGLAAQAAAKTVTVVVGKTNNTFVPAEIKAEVGDILEFRFWAKNHSVVSGDFSKGCTPASNTQGAFYSGFFPTQDGAANPTTFHVTINHTNPIPIYCAQAKHCATGMVAVINGGANGQTLDEYKKLAANFNAAGVAPAQQPFGGVNAPLQSSDSGSSSSSSSSSAGGGSPTPSTTTPGGTTNTTPTPTPSKSGNAAAGLAAAPVAGLLAAAAGVLFV